MIKRTGWTYGAEFELSDWDRREKLPEHFGLDLRDVTMVNSNGIAVDPRGELYHLGGEVLAAPSAYPTEVAGQLGSLLRRNPVVNYRSNLHCHVRVPGLRDNLPYLKRLQRYTARWMRELFPLLQPSLRRPEPVPGESMAARAGALARWRRRLVSHQTVISARQLARQEAARTPREFLEAEVRDPESGKCYWAVHPRCAVNLRQLRETDTIEFRHFAGTLDPEEVVTAVMWCRDFLLCAFDDGNPLALWRQNFSSSPFPTFAPYQHQLEVTYRLTSRKYNTVEVAQRNIARLLAGEPAEALL